MGFRARLGGENAQGFWFQLNGRQRQQATPPWGPSNPQALNRYSYVNNNPLRYSDPSGHLVDIYTIKNTKVDGSDGNRGVILALINKIKDFLNEHGAGVTVTPNLSVSGTILGVTISLGGGESQDGARAKLGDDLWSFLTLLMDDLSKLLDGSSPYSELMIYFYQNWIITGDHWSKMKYVGCNSAGCLDISETSWYFDHLGVNDPSEYIEDIFYRLKGTVYKPKS